MSALATSLIILKALASLNFVLSEDSGEVGERLSELKDRSDEGVRSRLGEEL